MRDGVDGRADAAAPWPVVLLTFANDRSPDESGRLRNLVAEKEALVERLGAHTRCVLVVEQNLMRVDLDRLVARYRDRLVGFHYGGHADEGALHVEGAGGLPDHLDADRLAEALGQCARLRWVFLNGCATGGQVAAIHARTTAPVVATAWTIADAVARDFAAAFYAGLAEGWALGVCFDEARRRVEAGGDADAVRSSLARAMGARARSAHRMLVPADADDERWPWTLSAHPGAPGGVDWRLGGALARCGLTRRLLEGGRPASARPGPDELLDPERRVVPYDGRAQLSEALDGWSAEPGEVRLLLITGAGGVGKTRALIEWQAARAGVDGLVEGALDAALIDDIAAVPEATVVVDDAHLRPAVASLAARLAGRIARPLGGRLRVILLARCAGSWWDSAVGPALGPYAAHWTLPDWPSAARVDEFRRAAAHFAAAWGRAGEVESPALDAPIYGRPLYLHVAALTAVTGQPPPSAALVEREARHWVEGIEGADDALLGAARATVAAASLRGRDAPAWVELASRWTSVAALGQRLGGLYPGAIGGPLGDAVISGQLGQVGALDWLALALRGADDEGVCHALRTLLRLEEREAIALGAHYARLLTVGGERWMALAFWVLVETREQASASALTVALAEALEERGTPALALRMSEIMPGSSVRFRRIAAWVEDALARERGPDHRADDARRRALRLLGAGRAAEAVEAAREAVALYGVESSEPSEERVARALDAMRLLAMALRAVGDRAACVAAAERAVDAARAAVSHRLVATYSLPCALLARSVIQGDGGQVAAALAGLDEAFERARAEEPGDDDEQEALLVSCLINWVLYANRAGAALVELEPRLDDALGRARRLASRSPDAHRPLLLGVLGNAVSALGAHAQHARGVELSAEAVELAHALYAAAPTVFAEDLARTLRNHVICLQPLGRVGEGVALAHEAVALARAHAERGGTREQIEYARTLCVLGAASYGAHEHGQSAITYGEAADIWRSLIAADSTCRSDLADALFGVARAHATLDQPETALAVVDEALALTREDEVHDAPYTWLPRLRVQCLAALGRLTEAIDGAEAVVVVERRMLADLDGVAPMSLCSALTQLGEIYVLADEPARAEPVFDEVLEHVSALAAQALPAYEALLRQLIDRQRRHLPRPALDAVVALLDRPDEGGEGLTEPADHAPTAAPHPFEPGRLSDHLGVGTPPPVVVLAFADDRAPDPAAGRRDLVATRRRLAPLFEGIGVELVVEQTLTPATLARVVDRHGDALIGFHYEGHHPRAMTGSITVDTLVRALERCAGLLWIYTSGPTLPAPPAALARRLGCAVIAGDGVRASDAAGACYRQWVDGSPLDAALAATGAALDVGWPDDLDVLPATRLRVLLAHRGLAVRLTLEPTWARARPCALLDPARRVVPFVGQQAAWAALDRLDRAARSVALIPVFGPAGAGKTRLLVEWLHTVRAPRGFFAGPLDARAVAELVRAPAATAVIDRAEGRRGLRRLADALVHRAAVAPGGRLRVVLIARTPGRWWSALLRDVPGLADLVPGGEAGVRVEQGPPDGALSAEYARAIEHFAAALGREVGDRAPPPDLAVDDSILSVHLAALAAVDGRFDAPSRWADLLGAELSTWGADRSRSGALSPEDTAAARRLLAAVTLIGGADRVQSAAWAARLGVGDRPFAALRRLYATPSGGLAALGPISLGDRLVREQLDHEPSWIDDALVAAERAALGDAMLTLARVGAPFDRVVERYAGQIETPLDAATRRQIAAVVDPGTPPVYHPLDARLATALAEHAAPGVAAALTEFAAEVGDGQVPRSDVHRWALTAALDEQLTGHRRAWVLYGLAAIDQERGRPADALPHARDALAAYRALDAGLPGVYLPGLQRAATVAASVCDALGRADDAWEYGLEAVEASRRLRKISNNNEFVRSGRALDAQLGRAWRQGRREAARALLDEAIELARAADETEPSTAFIDWLLDSGVEASELGRDADAATLERAAVALYRARAEAGDRDARRALAATLENLAISERALGDHTAAIDALAAAAAGWDVLYADEPGRYAARVVTALTRLAEGLDDAGRAEEATHATARAIDRAHATPSDAIEAPRAWTDALTGLAVRLPPDRYPQAVELYEAGAAAIRPLARAEPAEHAHALVMCLRSVAGLRLTLGHHSAARAASVEAVAILTELDSTDEALVYELALVRWTLGRACRALGDHPAAIVAHEAAIPILAGRRATAHDRFVSASGVLDVAIAYAHIGRADDYRRASHRAVELFAELAAEGDPEHRLGWASALCHRAFAELATEDWPAALAAAERCIALCEHDDPDARDARWQQIKAQAVEARAHAEHASASRRARREPH